MELQALLRGLPVELDSGASAGGASVAAIGLDVRGIDYDSRRVSPGDLFVAWRGARFDGLAFAEQAIERGAVAVLAQAPAAGKSHVPWLVCRDPRSLMGPLAARLFCHPERELILVGVTGTNGKTTVALLAAALLQAAGKPAGSLGTLGYRFRDLVLAGERTTPESSDLFRYLRAMRDAGAVAAAMEVSSHALVQGRVAGAAFDVAVLTNLTQEHLDFHGSMEQYFAAKRRLFDQLKEAGRAVVGTDDAWGRRLAAELGTALTFGQDGDVRPVEVRLGEHGIAARIRTPRGELAIESRLVGRYNLLNLLAALAVGEALELDRDALRAGVADFAPVPGRLERVDAGQDFPIFVDYAHTPAALAAALGSLRELTGRKLALVFGCGGDRDPGKRAPMGTIAGQLADLAIVANDNPRSEDPSAINAEVRRGIEASGARDYRVIPDRREAIQGAVAYAASRAGWCVVVAGKGHEDYQILGEERRAFSDRDEIVRAVEELLGSQANG